MNTKLLREETEVKQIKTDKTCPIGYKRNPSTYSIEIDELTAPKIRELFNTLAYEEPLSDEYTINMLIGLCRDNLAKICSMIQKILSIVALLIKMGIYIKEYILR